MADPKASRSAPKKSAQAAVKAPPAVDLRVEDQVRALPEAAGMTDMPELIKKLYARLVPRLLLPATARGILRVFGSVDVKAEKVAGEIVANPYIEFHFMKHVEALAKRETAPSVENAVVLLGMQRTRDLIVSILLLRLTRETHPEWDSADKLKISPDQILKYALATDEALAPYKREFSDPGYAAAVVYDFLMSVLEEVVPDPAARKRVLPFIDETHKHALKTAKIAAELARSMPDFTAKRYLLPLCLLQGLGRVAMALLDPDYLDFVESLANLELGRAVVRHLEEKRFGVASATMGVTLIQGLRLFRPIERAALFLDQPYLLKGRDRNLYQLCATVRLAANIAGRFQMPKGADDPIIAQWRGAELRDFKLDGRVLVDALSKVGA